MRNRGDGLDRRAFLGYAALVGLGAAGARDWAPQQPAPPDVAGGAGAAAPPFEIEDATIAELQSGMESGELTARGLVDAYLERIDGLDRDGPALHSILDPNPDARSIADALDRERKSKGSRGPLHGIPVLLKDNVATADRMTTTAGSLALEGSIAPRDAMLAERLRAAGAVLLAKTNMSEWANIRSSKSTSGWSGRGGQCRNPYVLDRNPCGSSSGSAVAVSANLGAVAIGTETDGSIVCPASANAVVGIKPTVGLVSRAGIIPISRTQDTAGPLTRTVADAAVLLGAIAGVDPRDPATAAARRHLEPDYTRFLDSTGLRGARIGVARRKLFGYSDAADRLAEAAIDVMKQEGAIIVDPADVPYAGEYDDAELEVLLYELKAGLNGYLTGLGPDAPVKSLHEVIEFNEAHRETEMPWFGQDLFERAQAKGPLAASRYRKALARCRRLSRTLGLDAVLAKHRLDALVAPTGNPPWPTDPVNGDHFTGGSSTPAAVAGYPSISVPAGFAFGLPVGISFFGRPWSEAVLIRLAHGYEQASRLREPPRFRRTVELPAG